MKYSCVAVVAALLKMVASAPSVEKSVESHKSLRRDIGPDALIKVVELENFNRLPIAAVAPDPDRQYSTQSYYHCYTNLPPIPYRSAYLYAFAACAEFERCTITRQSFLQPNETITSISYNLEAETEQFAFSFENRYSAGNGSAVVIGVPRAICTIGARSIIEKCRKDDRVAPFWVNWNTPNVRFKLESKTAWNGTVYY